MPTPLPSGLKPYTITVSRSKADVVDTVTVLHSNARDAAFAAIRAVRASHNLAESVALFATQAPK